MINTLQVRTRRITTMARWAARSAEIIAQLRAEIAQLRAEGAQSIIERAELHEEVVYWRRRAARREGLNPDETPPAQYVEALRTTQWEPTRELLVDVDGMPAWIQIDRHPAAAPDPLGEMRAWQLVVAAVRQARGTRAVLA
ncbi:hypothetical protein [Nonomuraea sp. NPDC023979]|uniref:hypothetical protein n=1 Tax=Nonomuraea sp. NPDC023979 TaxID=3154796 RepID=UPI0033CAD0CD